MADAQTVEPDSYQDALSTLSHDQKSLDAEGAGEAADAAQLYSIVRGEQEQLGESEKGLQDFQRSAADAASKSTPPVPPRQQANILNRLAPLLLLSAFGGRSAKLNAQAMLGATSGTIQGYLKGNADAVQQQQQSYAEAYKRWEDENKQFDRVYGIYLDAYKGRVDAQQKALDATLKTLQETDQKRRMTLQDKVNLDRARAQVVSQHENAQKTDYYRDMQLKLEEKKIQLQAQAQAQQQIGEGVVALVKMGEPVNSALPGYGQKSAEQRLAAQQQAIKEIAAENKVDEATAGQILARRQQVYRGIQTSVSQQAQMLGATRQSLAQLEYNIKMASTVMAQIPGSNISPVVNALARGQQKWTGDPKYSALFYYMYGVATESARILSGGQASKAQLAEGARKEAEEWVSTKMTPKSFIDGVAPAMISEGQNRVQNFTDAIREQLKLAGSDLGATPGERSAPGAAPPTVTSQADYDALPKGAQYIGPDGKTRTKS